MKHLLAFALLLQGFTAFAQLVVESNPTGAAVVVTQSSAVFVTWNARSGAPDPTTVVSEEGLFVLGGEVLGQVPTFLMTTIPANGAGAMTETLLIPPDIANRSFKQNAATFFYQRTFRSSADGSTTIAALTCRLSTSAYGNFSIASMTLFFENQRGETTFPLSDPEAHVYAEVHYNGTGLIKAQWEVQEPSNTDFRILQQVNYNLTYGDRIVFRSPAVPPLPTVVAGVHQVRFRILEPVSGFELPVITYYVTPDPKNKPQSPGASLKLVRPANDSQAGADVVFEWTGRVENCKVLKFSVFEKSSVGLFLSVNPATNPEPNSDVASSLSLQNPDVVPIKGVDVFSSALPADALRFTPRAEQWKRLRPGVKYLWQIQALDTAGKVMTESELRIFQIAGKE